MPNRNYLRGREFEYRTIRLLNPHYTSYRMAGSHGSFDVISFLTKQVDNLPLIRAIQCKVGKSSLLKAKVELAKMPLPGVVSKEIWHFVPRKGIFVHSFEGGEWNARSLCIR